MKALLKENYLAEETQMSNLWYRHEEAPVHGSVK